MQHRLPFALRTNVALVLTAGSTLFAAGACGDETTGPNNTTPVAVSVGDTISGTFHVGDTIRVFSFAAHANTYYAVFLQALSGTVIARVGYLGFSAPLGATLASPGVPFDQRATDPVWAHVDGTMEVRIVKSVASGPDASFRFVIEPIDPAPEIHQPAIQLNDTVSGETLQSIADLDEFTFPGQAGQVVISQIQALGPAASGTIRLIIRAPDGGIAGIVTSAGGDSTLADQVSGPVVLPVTGTYAAAVTSVRGLYIADKNYVGPYRFQVWALDSAPEHGSAQVAIGDTITEEIRPIGDIDEFHFTGSTGQEFSVFFQATSGRATDLLYLNIPVLVGGDPASSQSAGTDTSLFLHAVGRIRLSTPGPYTLRVGGAYDGPGGDRGPYRLYLYPIDRKPESVRDSLSLGDSVSGEGIAIVGDIDEYTLTVPKATLANVELWREATGEGSMLMLQIDPTNDCVNGLQAWPAAPGVAVGVATGTFLFPAGSHRIQVCGDASGSGYRGAYHFVTLGIDSLPEHARDTVLVGDTVQESIDQPGDLDAFVFHARKGEHLTAYYQGLAPTATGFFHLTLNDSAGSILRELYGANATGQLDARTSRYDVPVTGWYGLRLSPGQYGGSIGEVGAYRFALLDFPAGPEEVSLSVAIGDSVSGEQIDYDDDMDEFTLHGAPGTEFATYWQPVPGFSQVQIYDTTSQDTLRTMEDFLGGVQPAGRAVIPAAGVVGLRFTGTVGPYWFKTLVINRAPETAPATVAVGDTVRTESIDPVSDVDEFTFTGNQGDTIAVLFDTPQGAEYPGLGLEVIDLATDSVLGSVASYNPSNAFGDVRTGPIVLPHTGSYRIRVEGVDDRYGRGIYTFLIKSGT